MLKLSNIFIDAFIFHGAVGKFSIGSLFQSGIGECPSEILSELNPQTFVVSAVR